MPIVTIQLLNLDTPFSHIALTIKVYGYSMVICLFVFVVMLRPSSVDSAKKQLCSQV